MFYPTHFYTTSGKMSNTGVENVTLRCDDEGNFCLHFPDGSNRDIRMTNSVWMDLSHHLLCGVITKPLFNVIEGNNCFFTTNAPSAISPHAIDVLYSEEEDVLYHHLGVMTYLNFLTGGMVKTDAYMLEQSGVIVTIDEIASPVFFGKEEKTFPDVIEQRFGLYSKHEIDYQAEVVTHRQTDAIWIPGDVRVGENGTVMVGERMCAIRDGKIVESNERPTAVTAAYLSLTVTSGDYQKVFVIC